LLSLIRVHPWPFIASSDVAYPTVGFFAVAGELEVNQALVAINLKTAVDRRRCRQVRDLYGFPTAAQFTRWVTTAVSASTWG
jgi:hypothetical protein